MRPGAGCDSALAAAKQALRCLARRHQALTAEIKHLDTELRRLCERANPALLSACGVGAETAASLLVAAGDNPERMHSEASFAALCGTSPVEASSGRTVRHRLNRGGNRCANNALWRIAMVRLRFDERSIAYAARLTAEGKTRREILRCLKRHIIALSSGEGAANPIKHRLDFRGNRRINSVLYIASVTQQRSQPEAAAYLARKATEGKTRREARRAHKRQLANRIIRRMSRDEIARQQPHALAA